MAGITIESVTKRYGALAAVKDFTLEIADCEFVTLLGPSGCGKTTLLRLVAGFAVPDEGTIRVGEEILSTKAGVVPPERRGMGMVFQNYAVWPHRTVYANVAFGLEIRRVPRAETRARVGRVLELVNLAGLEERYPNQLSGGQQQRVALARSLVVEPSILLLDEPLSNLDAKLRERMRWELKDLQRRTGITFVYVTHDQSEALALSDRIAVMHQGRLQQYGRPRDVYARPANRTVADFMGLVNLVPARVVRAAGDESVVAVGGHHALQVALPPGAAVSMLIKRDLLVPFRPRNFEKISDDVKDPRGNHVAQRLNVAGIIARTDKGLELPKNWTDLTDPKYKGKLVMPDPSITAIQLMVVGALSHKYGWDFYQKLRANEIMIVQSHQQVSDTLVRGERLIAAEGADNYAWEARKAGHKVQMIVPTDGAFAIAAPTAIIKGSPHPNAAKALAEFMIGDTVQRLFPTEGIYAARSDIDPPAGSPPLKAIKLLPVDYARAEKEAKSLKDRFNEIYQ